MDAQPDTASSAPEKKVSSSEEAAPYAAERAALSDPLHQDALVHLTQVLSHRLSGLVSTIEGYTELLTDTLDTREQREMALRIFESTTNIERILSDLARYGQPVHPVRRPLRVRRLLQDLLIMFEDADAGRIAIEGGKDDLLKADPVLLRRALLVVVQNALEAVPAQETVWLCFSRQGPQARFEVWNDGAIDLESPAAQIFTPFFTTKAQHLGTGLCIARNVAEAHGGTLKLAVNSPSEGTCFALQLPAGDCEQHVPDSPATPAP